jgi:hypothetical protein
MWEWNKSFKCAPWVHIGISIIFSQQRFWSIESEDGSNLDSTKMCGCLEGPGKDVGHSDSIEEDKNDK